jgi:UDP:flavonoid glycosyltransferase YjiC (YdhE family)
MPAVQDIVNQVWTSNTLTLLAVSEQLCQRQPDWPDYVQVCGFLNMPNIEMEGSLSETVEQFLTSGHAPIYMTFGSLMPKDIPLQSETLALFSAAVRKVNCRAMIQTPDAERCGFSSSNDILFVSAQPHRQIFPRCRLIVHHGGAGTTQTSSFSGKPSVIVAHIDEQTFWGKELQRLGMTNKILKRRRVNANQLAYEIEYVMNDDVMTGQAQKVSALMQQEDGVAKAVTLINQVGATL